MKILQVQNLCKTYGTGETQVNALKNVSFSLEKGTFCAVVGESGSGKSTLLNCIGALDTPTSGEIRIDGHNLFALKEKEHYLQTAQYWIYLPVLPACRRADSGTKYYLSTAA